MSDWAFTIIAEQLQVFGGWFQKEFVAHWRSWLTLVGAIVLWNLFWWVTVLRQQHAACKKTYEEYLREKPRRDRENKQQAIRYVAELFGPEYLSASALEEWEKMKAPSKFRCN